jgi:hypothetical protein
MSITPTQNATADASSVTVIGDMGVDDLRNSSITNSVGE